MRTIVRGVLTSGILLFTWLTVSAIQTQTTGAPLMAAIAAVLLLVLWRALIVRSRRCP